MDESFYFPFGHFIHSSLSQRFLFSSSQMFQEQSIAGTAMGTFPSYIFPTPKPVSTGFQIRELLQQQDESDDENQRKTLESWQTEELERCFRECNYPSSAERGVLARKLRVDEHKLMNWFQNRRAKHRRMENTRKRPGRPSHSRPPVTCSGSPIPASEAAKKLEKKSLKKVSHRNNLPSCGRSAVRVSCSLESTFQRTFENERSKIEATEIKENFENYIEVLPIPTVDRTSTPVFGMSDRPNIVPVTSPICDRSRCGSPPLHSTPRAHQTNSVSSSLADSGVGSAFSSRLESDSSHTFSVKSLLNGNKNSKDRKTSHQNKRYKEEDEDVETIPRKKLRFSIESLLGM